jgi:prophage antirepressor-like protein
MDIQITFNLKGIGAIRVVIVEGKVWFVARDITKVGGWMDGKTSISHVPTRQTARLTVGEKEMLCLSEKGVETFIRSYASRPSIKAFRGYLNVKILPSIKETMNTCLNEPSEDSYTDIRSMWEPEPVEDLSLYEGR